MICFKCEEKDKFKKKSVRVEQDFKGLTFDVVVDGMVCEKCKAIQFTDEQSNALRRVTVDKYRKKNGLLTSDEVRKYREDIEMSQAQFSEYLGVGVASIKRWETCFVQDKSQDDLIRIKCDPNFAEKNALEVKWAHDHPDEYNGHKRFRIDLFKNILTKIIEVAPSPLFFFKAIFYIDFLHFKDFGEGITGTKYSRLEYGPIPIGYDGLINYLLDTKEFSRINNHDLKSNIKFDKSLFSTDELATINTVCSILEDEGKKHLLEKSHEEDAFTKCVYLDTLNYTDATSLKLTGE